MAKVLDLNKAVELFREAIEIVPMDHPREALYMSCLGEAFLYKFRESSSLEDLDYNSISLLTAAVETWPEGPTLGRAQSLDLLGDAYGLRVNVSSDPEDYAKYLELHEKSAYETSDSPTSRVNRAFITAFRLKLVDITRAVRLLRMAVELLPSNYD